MVAIVIKVAMVMVVTVVMVVMLVMVVMVFRTGQDRTEQNRHLNLSFQVTCDWQLLQFLRCFYYCLIII